MENILELQDFIDRSNFIQPVEKEETFFSIGGRGYFENPTSDILAFFMKPHAHGLHLAFVGAFFESLGMSSDVGDSLANGLVTVEREVRTDRGNWIDIAVYGKGWILAIENKIHHWVANPLWDYQAHITSLASSQQKYYAILSPSGMSPQDDVWTPVTYRSFVNELKVRLQDPGLVSKTTKWYLLAQEFILHLEQEICQSDMTEEEIKFVESNAKSIESLNMLSQKYLNLVAIDPRKALDHEGLSEFALSWQSWGFWMRSGTHSETWQFGLATPYHKKCGKMGADVYIWSCLPLPTLLQIMEKHAPCFYHTDRDENLWEFTGQFNDRDEAIREICRLASLFNNLDPTTLSKDSSC